VATRSITSETLPTKQKLLELADPSIGTHGDEVYMYLTVQICYELLLVTFVVISQVTDM